MKNSGILNNLLEVLTYYYLFNFNQLIVDINVEYIRKNIKNCDKKFKLHCSNIFKNDLNYNNQQDSKSFQNSFEHLSKIDRVFITQIQAHHNIKSCFTTDENRVEESNNEPFPYDKEKISKRIIKNKLITVPHKNLIKICINMCKKYAMKHFQCPDEFTSILIHQKKDHITSIDDLKSILLGKNEFEKWFTKILKKFLHDEKNGFVYYIKISKQITKLKPLYLEGCEILKCKIQDPINFTSFKLE